MLRAFSQDFYAPELAHLRKKYWAIVLRAVTLTLLLMWICLPVYWGALAYSSRMTSNLTAWFIDRDNSRLGHALWNSIETTNAPGPQLGWVYVDPDFAGSNQQIMDAVIGEHTWLAVVVEANATANLATARQNGDTTYNPASAITVYYAQARQETATGNYVVPLSTAILENATSSWATTSAQRYLAEIYAQGQINDTALQLLAKAPQTISPAVSWTTVNLRPFNAPVATAVTLVGQIFLCIFAFITAMANAAARATIQRHLRFSHYLLLRFAVPLTVYIPMSLTYALVSLAYQLPLNTRYSAASGFLLFWLYVYLGMAALGLALESMITILTPKFTPFFLFSLIIANIASAVLPDELQPAFFSFSVAFPVWNLSQAMRTIVFNTCSYLPRNAAVLVGWTLLSSLTLIVFTWYIRRCEIIATFKLLGKEEAMEKLEQKMGENNGMTAS
ncbi:hypothetical protein BJ138DRAFT_1162589 [Hygrophoropsis aurantiaca]|uniref:Uncharacterized protein n=1 Tax=Hygrophoropsis aurantiaca TaxID=72124 RepID=A0ACB7ZZX2_9AGAM|nr:hypothetical protein BJ138DRAFT_1162589 [Hygrophoropsis aurantiaca]